MVRTSLVSRLAVGALMVAGLLAIVPQHVSADMIPPIVTLSDGTRTIHVPQDTFMFDPETNEFASAGNTYVADSAGLGFTLQWDLVANPDPYLTGTISVLNFSGATQNFTLSYIQPVSPAFAGPTNSRGSIEISVQDFFNSGAAQLTTAGSLPIYQPMIDGVNQPNTLLNTANLVVSSQGGIAGLVSSFGPVYGGPAIANDIGVVVNFSLTNLDLASGTVYYEVVPEPASLVIMAAGMVAFGLALARRRG